MKLAKFNQISPSGPLRQTRTTREGGASRQASYRSRSVRTGTSWSIASGPAGSVTVTTPTGSAMATPQHKRMRLQSRTSEPEDALLDADDVGADLLLEHLAHRAVFAGRHRQ